MVRVEENHGIQRFNQGEEQIKSQYGSVNTVNSPEIPLNPP